jgi:hypothetical protein
MIILFTWIAITGFWVWRAQKNWKHKGKDWSIIAVIVFTVFGAMTLYLGVGITLSRVEYRLFVEEKAALEKVLLISSAGVVVPGLDKNVADWNKRLVQFKIKNNEFFAKETVDDRFNNLKAIK